MGGQPGPSTIPSGYLILTSLDITLIQILDLKARVRAIVYTLENIQVMLGIAWLTLTGRSST